MPKNYRNLVEKNLPKYFFEILEERETLSRTNSVKKALRRADKDQLSKIEEMAITNLKTMTLKEAFLEENENMEYPHTHNHNSNRANGSVGFGSIDPNKDISMTEGNENAA